ncbi:MAG: DUF192 domain-containing protein [Bacteroidales bacterium]|nr:DUF192 domain-containing protein [Bacteroidales bacterium]MDD3526214.1 DUF192 domain-containing protein [Bacteroidales bacterium]MDD4175994.1 DUF192 domain-containing protein [Bacteroidales bacterium]NCU35153.1 DUF192 domain-containing protein [Candidatus Falkowbacteria bacterium]
MKNKKRSTKAFAKKQVRLAIVAIVLLLIFVFVYVISNQPMWGERTPAEKPAARPEATVFDIEGQLTFTDAEGAAITTIYIEIADDEYSRERGMMYRHYILDTVGMLFIFPDEARRWFWMHDTPSSLDIMYADGERQITRIIENAVPYSDESMPSGDPAKYVIEVQAGFAARHQIQQGHRFSWFSF